MFKKLMAGKSVTLCCVPSVLCFALFPLICSVLCVFPLVCVLFLLCCAPSDVCVVFVVLCSLWWNLSRSPSPLSVHHPGNKSGGRRRNILFSSLWSSLYRCWLIFTISLSSRHRRIAANDFSGRPPPRSLLHKHNHHSHNIHNIYNIHNHNIHSVHNNHNHNIHNAPRSFLHNFQTILIYYLKDRSEIFAVCKSYEKAKHI